MSVTRCSRLDGALFAFLVVGSIGELIPPCKCARPEVHGSFRPTTRVLSSGCFRQEVKHARVPRFKITAYFDEVELHLISVRSMPRTYGYLKKKKNWRLWVLSLDDC